MEQVLQKSTISGLHSVLQGDQELAAGRIGRRRTQSWAAVRQLTLAYLTVCQP